MYGDNDDTGGYQDPQSHNRRAAVRPLSFVPSPLGDSLPQQQLYGNSNGSGQFRPAPLRTPSHEKKGATFAGGLGSPSSPTEHRRRDERHDSPMGNGNGSGTGSGSTTPTSLNRSPSEASQHFPITDLDSHAAVAQELSNLQAIRRMSMGVQGEAAVDPDLPTFSSGMHIPSVAPIHDADEQDPATMFWVPASVHPELAPKAFESFIQDRVKTIRRSSLSTSSQAGSSLAPASDGGSSLRRKKSMLSRQVNDGSSYQDGAERLKRERSSMHREGLPSLQELEDAAHDPSSLMRRLSIDDMRKSLEEAQDGVEGEHMPILPPKPMGQGLKRSKKTTYRRGSQRKGERLVGRRIIPGENSDPDKPPALPSLPNASEIPQLPTFSHDLGGFEQSGLQKVQTEPTPPKSNTVNNFSRPGRKPGAMSPPAKNSEFENTDARPTSPPDRHQSPSPESHTFPPRGSSARSPPQMQVPTIVETPPAPQDQGRPYSAPTTQRLDRTTSLDQQPLSQPPQAPLPARPSRPQLSRPASLQHARAGQHSMQPQQKTTFDQIGVQPAIPSQSTRTDSLSIIPTYADADKKGDSGRKGKDKKDDGTRKSSWSSFFGSKEDTKKAEEESKQKQKQKLQRPGTVERHDDTRLDVLQTQIDGGQKPRESLVLDRSQIQVEQPKPGRKTSHDGSVKKEKDSSLFSSLFGNKKKSSEKDHTSRIKAGSSLRNLSPSPPPRRLQPDVDFNWSRFSILEERAIYRMAHIKLANPRRELYSQVLLSNFMYSYLAKVQQMHPGVQVPLSAAQKKAKKVEEERKRKEAEAAAREQQERDRQAMGVGGEEFREYQRYQDVSFSLLTEGRQSGSENWADKVAAQQQSRAEPSSSSSSNQQAAPIQHPPRGGSLIDGARNAPTKQQPQQPQSQHQDEQDAGMFSQYTQQFSSTNGNGNQHHGGGYAGSSVGGGARQHQQQDYYEYEEEPQQPARSGKKGGRRDWME